MKTFTIRIRHLGCTNSGREKYLIRRIKGIPVQESIEFKILQLRRELRRESTVIKYQIYFFGKWRTRSERDYLEAEACGFPVRKIEYKVKETTYSRIPVRVDNQYSDAYRGGDLSSHIHELSSEELPTLINPN